MTTLFAANLPLLRSAWLDILKKYGIATVFALVLLWFLLSVVAGKLDANAAKTDDVKATVVKHDTEHKVHEARAQAIQEQQLKTLVALCRNASTTSRERELCGDIR